MDKSRLKRHKRIEGRSQINEKRKFKKQMTRSRRGEEEKKKEEEIEEKKRR